MKQLDKYDIDPELEEMENKTNIKHESFYKLKNQTNKKRKDK